MTEVRFYIADIPLLRETGTWADLCAQVPAVRREQTEAFCASQKRWQHLGAGLLLRRAVQDAGLDGNGIRIVRTENGKPELAGLRNRFQFSLSHSGERIFCAAVSRREGNAPAIGCDTEKLRPVSGRIAERHFFPEESKYIRQQTTDAEKTRCFFRIWTLKESYLKMTGAGLAELHIPRIVLPFSESTADVPIAAGETGPANVRAGELLLDAYSCAWCIDAGDSVAALWYRLQPDGRWNRFSPE